MTDRVDEKDILERALLFVLDVLGRNKIKLLLALLVGGVLGVSVSFLKPRKYKSTTMLLPEMTSGGIGSLGSLASLAGIETGGSGSETDAIRPDVYPNILKSSPALLSLLSQPVQTDSGKHYKSLLNYYEALHGVKINPQFLKLNMEDSIYKYQKQELGVIGSLKGSIEAEFDKKSGLISISVEMQDGHVAAMVLANGIKYLKAYVTDYRYGKKHNQKDFVDSQLQVAKQRMMKTRLALQSFRDKNRNLFLNTAKIEENKLEDEYNVAQEVYNSLIKQSETLTISEKQTKPVFEVLDPPMVPNGKSAPNRLFYGIGGAFLAFILVSIAVIIIYSRKPKKELISSSIA